MGQQNRWSLQLKQAGADHPLLEMDLASQSAYKQELKEYKAKEVSEKELKMLLNQAYEEDGGGGIHGGEWHEVLAQAKPIEVAVTSGCWRSTPE